MELQQLYADDPRRQSECDRESCSLREGEERRRLTRQLGRREAAREAPNEWDEPGEEEEKTESEKCEDGGNRPKRRAEPRWRRRAGQSNARTFGPAPRITAAASPTFSKSPVKNGRNPR